jgi:type I restriction enzyme S subunit
MAGRWREQSLGELTENFDGVRVPVREADRRRGPYPYYGASGIVDHVDEFLFDGEYLLIAEDGENLRTRTTPIAFMARGKFWVNNHAHIVRGNTQADTRFLMYALAASDISGYLTGSTMPKLTQGNMNRIPVFTPPLPEQRAIAHILGTLDDKIELNRRMSETLEAMARALFKSWFVDFDPVRAKAEGRDPGLPKPLADLFPDSFEDSDLGEIPKGWSVATLADFALLNSESWSKETYPEQIEYVDLSITKWGRIETTTHHRRQDAPSRAQRVLRRADTIVGTVRPANGSYAFVSSDGLTASTGFAVLRPRRPECAEFVYLTATSSGNIDRLSQLADGGAYPAVRPEVVAASQLIRPCNAVMARFAKLCRPLLAKLGPNERTSATLAALRDTLLTKLLSGEVTPAVTMRAGDRVNG